MDLAKMAERVASAEEDERVASAEEDDVYLALQKAEAAGYKVISGPFRRQQREVYHALALSKRPEAWEPYRAPRHLRAARPASRRGGSRS